MYKESVRSRPGACLADLLKLQQLRSMKSTNFCWVCGYPYLEPTSPDLHRGHASPRLSKSQWSWTQVLYPCFFPVGITNSLPNRLHCLNVFSQGFAQVHGMRFSLPSNLIGGLDYFLSNMEVVFRVITHKELACFFSEIEGKPESGAPVVGPT